MEDVYSSGKVKAIGLSNWSMPNIKHLKETWTIVPAVNQVELHPYLPQHALKEYCDKEHIMLEAYSPLGSTSEAFSFPVQTPSWRRSVDSPLLADPDLKAIANAHGVSIATVLVSYQVNRSIVVLPKSVTESRIADNLRVIRLSDADMKTLNGMAASGKQQRLNTPPWGWDLGFDDWYGPAAVKA
jgi:glycerol 2-dehydrogenase (NADP+)